MKGIPYARLTGLLLAAVGSVLLYSPSLAGDAAAFSTARFSQPSNPIEFDSAADLVARLLDPAAGGPSTVRADDLPPHPERLIVRLLPGANRAATFAAAGVDARIREAQSIEAVAGLHIVSVAPADRAGVLAALRADPDVAYAEPDYVARLNAMPNDTLFEFQWGLLNPGDPVFNQPGIAGADINAPPAWDLWTGDPDFRIAVIDSGIDYTHPDLAPNVWTNPGEIPANGLDDDGNGYVDDVHGYDFAFDDSDPRDFNGHGTHVSGTIGAMSNNLLGVTGVNWRCAIVALRAFNDFGQGHVSDIIEALQYVHDNDIRLSNNSWTLYEHSQALYDTIEALQFNNHLFIVAAGNELGRDIDISPVFPAVYPLPNIVAVAATASDDTLSFVSNIGAISVDLGAPGQDILSTLSLNLPVQPPGYAYATGTSMATAFVTGGAGLLMSRRPDLTWDQVRHRMLATVRPVDALAGRTVSGGVLDLAALVGDCNGNLVFDENDIAGGFSFDCNLDGIPDECQADCNANGLDDACDISAGTSPDCNGNQRPDECEIDDGSAADCNTNAVPDACDIALGTSTDLNGSSVPDECESCTTTADCEDGSICTIDDCIENLCYRQTLTGTCDDGDPCTEGDTCVDGLCLGQPSDSLDCAPRMSVKAAAINGQSLAAPAGQITATRGDRITVEFYFENWDPRIIQGYNLKIDPAGFDSGAVGQLTPVDSPTPDAGAFVDRSRPDWAFHGLTTITVVQVVPPEFYQYISVIVQQDDCAPDPGVPVYGGTMVLDLSATAAGTFQLCLDENFFDSSFLIDCPVPTAITPIAYSCLTIDVPLSGCDNGPDCNGNGSWDVCDIVNGTSEDCNRNDVPDECDFADGTSQDCNANGLPDECDIADQTSEDCDANGVPDECQPDCNANGVIDACDLLQGTSEDCNTNAVPDECDIAGGASTDCPAGPGNGIPDECEADCNDNLVADSCDLAVGTSPDEDENTIPDECQRTLPVPQKFPTIQDAIDFALPGDIVKVADGHYAGPGFTELNFLGKIITVRSAGGPENCILDAEGNGNVAFFRRGETRLSRLEGFSLVNAASGIRMERNSSPTVRNCFLSGHWGAALNLYLAEPLFEECLIEANRTNITAWHVQSNPTYYRCAFVGNTSGGIFLEQSDATILDSIFLNNEGSAGGALWIRRGKALVRNSTFVGNAANTGAAIIANRSELTLDHVIIWDNLARSSTTERPIPNRDAIRLIDSVLHVSDSLVAAGPGAVRANTTSLLFWNQGNFDADPVFESTARGEPATVPSDLRLSEWSPCIDAGNDDTKPFDGEQDYQGDPRLMLAGLDIGADEALTFADCNANGIPDGRDLLAGRELDCNRNFQPDACEIADGSAPDQNSNGVPDECEKPSRSRSRTDRHGR